MNIFIKFNKDYYQIFYLTRRNAEGGFSGSLSIIHPNPNVEHYHFTYPSNGKYHFTIKLKDGRDIKYFDDQIIEYSLCKKPITYKGAELFIKLKEMAGKNLIPFDIGRNPPSFFEIINSGKVVPLTNYFINLDALRFHPIYKKNPRLNDLILEIKDPNKYKINRLILEVIISKDGRSNQVGVEVICEKKLDSRIPIVVARFLKQIINY